jgi:hypothetical protein
MIRTTTLGRIGRRTLGLMAAGILAGLLLAAGARAAAAGDELPSFTVRGLAPGTIAVDYSHSGTDGTLWYTIERKDGERRAVMFSPNGQFLDSFLEPNTVYEYRVCVVYEDEEEPLCPEVWVAGRTMPAPGRPANYDPPTITNIEVAEDAIKVTWGPTGDYTKILARIDDELGNHSQLDLPNRPNGSHTFEGLRAGARYRVILKGCSLSLNNGCGPWSPDVFVTTSAPYQEPPPPGKPRLTVGARFTEAGVPLRFSVVLAQPNHSDHFIVYRDGREVTKVYARANASGRAGTHTDPVQTRHSYHVCFEGYSPRATVCSDTVAGPQPLGERPASEVLGRPRPCVVGLGGCDQDEDEEIVDIGIIHAPAAVHPDTCKSGYVWREAFPGDTVCVTPATRAQAAADNAQAAARRAPGSLNCISGYVWRVARPDDLVCVTPEVRAQTAADNAQANQRRAVPR